MQASAVVSPAVLAASALRGSHISDAHVEAFEGRLILRGLASSYRTKQLAGERVRSAVPAMTIVNELRVAQSPSDDRRLARHVTAAIQRAAPGAGKRVRVCARAGVVEIDGVARNADERCAIESAAWQTNGVFGVDCRLTVEKADDLDMDVAGALQAYIHRCGNVPSRSVRVEYRAGIATISGTVDSEAHAQAIEDLVRWHERVADVVSHLRVAAHA